MEIWKFKMPKQMRSVCWLRYGHYEGNRWLQTQSTIHDYILRKVQTGYIHRQWMESRRSEGNETADRLASIVTGGGATDWADITILADWALLGILAGMRIQDVSWIICSWLTTRNGSRWGVVRNCHVSWIICPWLTTRNGSMCVVVRNQQIYWSHLSGT